MKKNNLIFAVSILFGTHCAALETQIPTHVRLKLESFAQQAYSTPPTIYNSYLLALDCISNNIEGDIVECGVAAGAQSAAMAFACQSNSSSKLIHLFDSFQGIPLAGPHDDQQPGIIGPVQHDTNVPLESLLVSSGITVHSLEQVQHNMYCWGIDIGKLRFYKGWFQHTLPEVAPTIDRICILRLDGDLYESTKVCLEHLYPKVSKGGYVVIDDNLPGCLKAVHEYLEQHNINVTMIPIEGGNGPMYWQVQ